jgi:hypothetical protein
MRRERHAQLRSTRPAASIGQSRKAKTRAGRPPRGHDHIRRNTTLRLFPGISVTTGAKNPTDCALKATASRSRRPRAGLRSRQAPIECLVARGRFEPFAYVRGRRDRQATRRKYRGGPLIIPMVASHGECGPLMQMIPSADAIGQTECERETLSDACSYRRPTASSGRRASEPGGIEFA